jgi:hypothetical protein
MRRLNPFRPAEQFAPPVFSTRDRNDCIRTKLRNAETH